jgi:S-formylglutathione hydrolase FrmB
MKSRKVTALLMTTAMAISFGISAMAAEDASTAFAPGATVTADEESPSGYTVHFVYENTEENVASVSVTGPFQYIDPTLDLHDETNAFSPYDYKSGMYASNCAPGPFSWGYTEEMTYDEATNTYSASFPITSGSFAYSYVITYEDETTVTIDDPANPSPAKQNPNSNTATGDLTHSIVYGQYDEEKQAGSPNLDFVRPSEGETGTMFYVEYEGNLAEDQDLGIYLPAGYDADREEPYKVVYTSHGGGGNETDWFAMGHVDNIADNLGADVIIVTMDNASYQWDFEQIEDNVLNDIIPYMEENYNVSTEAADRAFCGLSMGSMTTLHMFFDYPQEFGYFGAFSGADMSAVTENEGIFTTPLYITVGTCDIASEQVMPNGEGQQIKYEDLIAWVEENNAENVIDGGYLPGAHDWFVWSQSFKTFLDEICWAD